jgi:hypothetical protein
MRFRLSSPWPLQGGAWTAPAGTVIDWESPDHWSICARGLTPPYDAQALDAGTYQFMQGAYPEHHHLMGPPPPTESERRTEND